MAKQTHSSNYMILLECLHAQSHVSSPRRLPHCDAPKPGGPLTTCQPTEYKSGTVSFVRGALPKYNTCISYPNSPIYAIYVSNTATWAHKQYSIYMPTMNPTKYPIVTRVNMFLLLYNIYQTYRVLIHVNIVKATPGFLLIQPLGRAVPSHAPCTCKKRGVPRRGELKLSRRIALSGLLTT